MKWLVSGQFSANKERLTKNSVEISLAIFNFFSFSPTEFHFDTKPKTTWPKVILVLTLTCIPFLGASQIPSNTPPNHTFHFVKINSGWDWINWPIAEILSVKFCRTLSGVVRVIEIRDIILGKWASIVEGCNRWTEISQTINGKTSRLAPSVIVVVVPTLRAVARRWEISGPVHGEGIVRKIQVEEEAEKILTSKQREKFFFS